MSKRSPRRRALEICDTVLYPSVGAGRRVDAAWEALRISLDCCTAYTLLAWHHAKDDSEALRLHHQAVEAGERALEEIRLKRHAARKRLFRWPGEFPEAVAYARSRLALARALHEAGEPEAAIGHARAVFDANEDESTDPLGASHILIPLLEQRESEQGESSLSTYGLPESIEVSDNLEWVGRENFEIFWAWGGKTDYEIAYWRAQEIIYSLAEHPWAEDPSIRELYADGALEICADSADAYVMLGDLYEECADLESARECYESGVRAAERALKKLRGEDVFEKDRGHFYGVLESRPYVGARRNLALTLYELGEQEAAERHARELLVLNEMDNLGIRYLLAQWLYEQDRAGDLEKHLREHNAFSDDPCKHDVGFENDMPHVLPESYWEGRK